MLCWVRNYKWLECTSRDAVSEDGKPFTCANAALSLGLTSLLRTLPWEPRTDDFLGSSMEGLTWKVPLIWPLIWLYDYFCFLSLWFKKIPNLWKHWKWCSEHRGALPQCSWAHLHCGMLKWTAPQFLLCWLDMWRALQILILPFLTSRVDSPALTTKTAVSHQSNFI